MSSSTSDPSGLPAPVMQPVEMHLYRPNEPVEATITKNELCTAGRKAAGYVRHIEFDVSGTLLAGRCFPGQSIGVIADGLDQHGKPHKVRLYSLASPALGEDATGNILSTTVKRTIDEHWETHGLFLGVCSNFLCDRKPGDKIKVSGPNGKRFVLPADINAHDYIFVATGTGIAPFRGMVMQLLNSGCTSRIVLIMGSPYATDLLYHDLFNSLAQKHKNFSYITAISRERNGEGSEHGRLYVQDRFRTDHQMLSPVLNSPRTLLYICGLAGMELGIFQELAQQLRGDALKHFLQVDPAALGDIRRWQRSMIHKEVRPTKRVFMEVYA